MKEDLYQKAKWMKDAAAACTPFSPQELDAACNSLRNLVRDSQSVDWLDLRRTLSEFAHQPPKDWLRVERAATELKRLFFKVKPNESLTVHPAFKQICFRVFKGGFWESGEAHAGARTSQPWVVLVCGLNAIRKTTAFYEDWFPEALSRALEGRFTPGEVPTGQNSFFRQLDHIVATVANEEFRNLYQHCSEDVRLYSALKDAIFARYRTIAEIWGVLLVREAQKKRMNILVETSGKDVGMFHYLNYLFNDDSQCRKLAVHFNVNDVHFAELSVDNRMKKEMRLGKQVLTRLQHVQGGSDDQHNDGNVVNDLIATNQGGPYGSAVLRKVYQEGQEVWARVMKGQENMAEKWDKANMLIVARDGVDGWQATAGSPATTFLFSSRPTSKL